MSRPIRPVTISLRKMKLYQNRSETPLMDFFKLSKMMERIAELEEENQQLRFSLNLKGDR